MKIFSDELWTLLRKNFPEFEDCTSNITEHDAYEIQNFLSHKIDLFKEKIVAEKNCFRLIRYKRIFEEKIEVFNLIVEEFSLYKRNVIDLVHGKFYEIVPEEKFGGCIVSKIRFLAYLSESRSCWVEVMLSEKKIEVPMNLGEKEYVFLSPLQSFSEDADERPRLQIVH